MNPSDDLPTDSLTGLPARSALLPQVEQALAAAGRDDGKLAFLFVDVDHLMKINDRFGHQAGDAAIQAAARGIQSAAPRGAIAGRTGGDEFLLALPGVAVEEAEAVAEEIRAAVQAAPLAVTGPDGAQSHAVSVTIGIALFPDDGRTLTELNRKAYEAMLRGKEGGGSVVRVYANGEERDPLTGALTRYALLSRFDAAVEQGAARPTPAALIVFDIDDFSSINRQYGRYTGDEVLRHAAHILASNFTEGVVGRYAGDEFAVLLPGARSETAFVLAEEVRKSIEDAPLVIQAGDQKTGLTIHLSGGVAEYPSDGAEWIDLFRKADEALYRAKRNGRNRICLSVSTQMVTKTAHFTQTQLEKLAALARSSGRSEAALLREGLDDLFRKYDV